MSKMEILIQRLKTYKEAKKKFRAAKCNNADKKFTRGQNWAGRERICEHKDRTMEIIQSEEQKENIQEKWMKPKEPVGYHQVDPICVVGSLEGEKREKVSERIFEKIMVHIVPNLMKDIYINI